MRNLIFLLIWLIPSVSFSQWFGIEEIGGGRIINVSESVDYIYYTTNGSVPNRGNRSFKESLTINKNTTFLFRAVIDGKLSDSIVPVSIIFDKHRLPILSLFIAEEDLWNDSTGIYCKGKNAYWNDSTKHWENCNYQQKWERPIYMQYIDENGNEIQQKCGLKIFGESTRRQPDKSMKIIARSNYGNNKFNFPFFKNDTLSEFKQLVIRTSGNDYRGSRFKDVLNTYLARNLDLDAMNYQPVQLYVNGEYWGLYNLREKINEHYFASHYNIDKDSVNIVMGRWVPQQGSSKNYREMYFWFSDLDTMDNASYEKAQSYIDIRNYINFRVFQIYINNADSRGNVRYWQSPELDNKFRMVLYDTDLSYGTARRKLLTSFISKEQTVWFNPEWSTMYLRKLLQNKEFENEFVVQFAHLMNTSLHKDTMLAAIDLFESEYKNDLPRPGEVKVSHLRKVALSEEAWMENVNDLRKFSKMRPKYMYEELKEVFGFDGYANVQFSGENAQVEINNNYPQKVPYFGKYPQGYPLAIKIIPDSGFTLTQVDTISLKDTINYTLSVVPQSDSLSITFNTVKKITKKVVVKNDKAYSSKSSIGFQLNFEAIAYLLIILGLFMVIVSLILRRRS